MKKLFLTLLVICVVTIAHGQSANVNIDSLQRNYMALAKSTDPKILADLKKESYNQLKSKDEKRWIMAANIFFQLKMNSTADSVLDLIKKQYPKGIVVRNKDLPNIYNETDPFKKERVYNEWIKKYKPELLGPDVVYDYARESVGQCFAEAGNSQKAMEYANLMDHPTWKSEGWAIIATYLMKAGDFTNAGILIKRSIENAEKYTNINRKSNSNEGFLSNSYYSYCKIYADILYQQKKYSEAWEYLNKSPKPRYDQVYVNVLLALGRNLEAFRCLDALVTKGQGGPEAVTQLKELYIKLNGSAEGYEKYLSSIKESLEKETHEALVKSMINEQAPNFSLKDTDGNTVTLSDFKGKIVILDFWATWCTPCKKSFPAMQMAVNIYKDDPNVKFLFIHTWEKEEDATKSAINYLKENNYSFKLLMDLKDPVTKTNKVIESYKVTGIPTKFIIDGKGNICFKVTGFSGGNEAAVEEISKMIEMAKRR